MIINVTYDSSVNSAPAAFKTAFAAAVQFLDNTFINPITISIYVGFGEIGPPPNNQSLPSNALGESETYFNQYSYAQIKTALTQNPTSTDQVSAANSLPATDPTPGGTGNYWVATAAAKALGLSGASGPYDGWIGFSSSLAFDYDNSNGVTAGTYDFYAVALHELTEVMGRGLFVGNDGIGSNSFTPLDLFHYSSNGVRDFSGTTAGYFSPDGGATNLDKFNTNVNGDFGDWASSAGNDSFLAFSNSGAVNAFSQADIREMNVLGYDLPPPVSAFIGDFNGDVKSDIVWLNGSSNTPTMWLMNGASITSSTVLPTPPSSWTIVGTGDFYDDGKSDLLWQNSNGQPGIWNMNGASIVSSVALPMVPSEWRIVGTGDFNHDAHSDILWIDTITNTPGIWEMNGSSIVSSAALATTPPQQWKIVGTGDFDGGGTSDILWLNTANNTPSIWEMNGTSIVSSTALTAPPASWRLVGTGDVNGDHMSDILWQNSSGDAGVWEMNGTSIIASADVGNPGAAWQLKGAGDFNGDGKSDLLFLNPGNDQVQIWIMNGTQVVSMQALATTAAQSGAQGGAQGGGAALSSSPVLAQTDAYYPATSVGTGGFADTPMLRDGPSGQGVAPVVGSAPSVGLGGNGSVNDPLGTTRGLLTVA